MPESNGNVVRAAQEYREASLIPDIHDEEGIEDRNSQNKDRGE